jgi:hypothetical protein
VKALIKRIKEPSTWAGLAALATLFGAPTAAVDAVLAVVNTVAGAGVATPSGVVQTVGAVCALAAVLLPERKAVPAPAA